MDENDDKKNVNRINYFYIGLWWCLPSMYLYIDNPRANHLKPSPFILYFARKERNVNEEEAENGIFK